MSFIKRVIDELYNVDVVSFDVFDTLLLRKTRYPYQVFDRTYELAGECFPDYISKRDWRAIRMTLPSIAKEKNNDNFLSLKDYLAEVPFFIKNKEKLYYSEIQAEKDSVFINLDILLLIKKCRFEFNKRIVLISDMYLTGEEIKDLLSSAGMELSLIDYIFVSKDCHKRKDSLGDSNLFKFACEKIGCSPMKMLHIGDSYKSDYINAKLSGLKAIPYFAVSQAKYIHNYLPYESNLFCESDNLGKSLYSLRCLASSKTEYVGEKKCWFEMGAMSFGPLLTFAAEWVLDIAEKENIKNIYPFMREGLFFSKLLANAARNRNWNGTIEPMYISRQALFPAILSVFEKRDVFFSFLANNGISRNLTVGNVLLMYNADSNNELFKYKDVTMRDANRIIVGDKTINQIMNECYFSNIEKTREIAKDYDQLIWDYFCSLKMDKEPFITFDFGYGGTTQNAIERLLRHRKSKFKRVHLLVVGKHAIESRGNFGNDTDIRGFASTLSDDKEYTDVMNSQICDSLLKCNCGSIVGYKRENNIVIPLLGDADFNPKTLDFVEAFQEGVLSFQKCYFETTNFSKNKFECSRHDLLMMAARLTVYPTKKEAIMLGKLSSDSEMIIEKREFTDYKQNGFDAYFQNRFIDGTARRWYSGLNAIADGLRYYHNSLMNPQITNEYLYSLYAKRVVNNFKSFVIVGSVDEVFYFTWSLLLLDEWDKCNGIICDDLQDLNEVIFNKKAASMRFSQSLFINSKNYIILARDKNVISIKEKELKETFENCNCYNFYSF